MRSKYVWKHLENKVPTKTECNNSTWNILWTTKTSEVLKKQKRIIISEVLVSLLLIIKFSVNKSGGWYHMYEKELYSND